MEYDHHRKAGKQGDCVKHPALIAALNVALRPEVTELRLGETAPRAKEAKQFHYLDVFAGHAWHPLIEGNKYGWKDGIGQFAPVGEAPDSVKCWWRMWHDAPKWPTTNTPGYPGSTWIAAYCCRKAKRRVRLELYDHSEEVRRDLERAFPASHAIQKHNRNSCVIGQSLELCHNSQKNIEQADFVFIDPPHWWSGDNPSYPRWSYIRDHVLGPRRNGRPTLMWMPSSGISRAFQKKPNGELAEAAELGYRWSAVRWKRDCPGTACFLVYNTADDPIQEAIAFIAGIFDWMADVKDASSVVHSYQLNSAIR